MTREQAATRGRAAWPKDALRVTFGIIWLIDAVLKWLPGFRAGYMSTIMGQADGQPGWLPWWSDFWIRAQHPQATFFADLVAVVETLIALTLIAGLFALSYHVGTSRYSADYYLEKEIFWW